VFRYERPMPLNLLLRALPDLGYISAKHLYEDKGDIRQNPLNLAPVGTGPFKFVQYERGQYIIADRNPNYWRPNAPLSRSHRLARRNRSRRRRRPDGGRDRSTTARSRGLTISDLARLSKDPRFIVSTKGNEGNARTNTIEFNFRRKELADIRVRRAIAHALNIPFFIENFLGEFAKRGTGPIPSVSTDFYPADNGPQVSVRQGAGREAARRSGLQGRRGRHALLAAPSAGARGARTSRCSRPSSSSRYRTSASRSTSCATMAAASSSRSMTTTPSISRADGINTATIRRSRPRVWYRSGQPKGAPWTNQWDWTDPKIDKVIDDAATEVDPVKRKALYGEFVRGVNTELPIWTPIEQIFVTTINAKARNHSNTPRWARRAGTICGSPNDRVTCAS
jgi:peptide/nickel transport system substrate-binding protein